MRHLPTIDNNGYQLDSGEQRHLEAPETFYLPPRSEREALEQGDIAKLMFDIVIDGDVNNVALERMWVQVVDCEDGVYSGHLDNNPFCSDEGEIALALGDTVYFGPEHVIMIYTTSEMEERQAQRDHILKEVTEVQALKLQKQCEDRKALNEMIHAGIPVIEILEKYNLTLPDAE